MRYVPGGTAVNDSGTPINLAKARKLRARKAARAQADANAVKFGRSKAAKQADRARRDQAARSLEAHRRGHDDGSGDGDQ